MSQEFLHSVIVCSWVFLMEQEEGHLQLMKDYFIGAFNAKFR